MSRAVRVILAALLVTACPPVRLTAQDSLAHRDSTRHDSTVVADTSHQVKPAGALWRSLLIPGWGQAVTGRQLTGGLFVAWEGLTATMTIRAEQEANYMKATGSANLPAKRQQVQDWLVLWIFNHLFSGAEAFVAAHLQDFPKDLQFEAAPGGVRFSMPLRRP